MTDRVPSTKIISLDEVRHRIGKCSHNRVRVDETLATVECRDCGEQLNPIYVLKRMANEEALLFRRMQGIRKLNAKLEKRSRCKCDHCGQMTRIHIR